MNRWDKGGLLMGSRAPQPRMDWDKIRKAKRYCEECENFDWQTGGCRLGLIPDETCKKNKVLVL